MSRETILQVPGVVMGSLPLPRAVGGAAAARGRRVAGAEAAEML